jgi:hypothetical protein
LSFEMNSFSVSSSIFSDSMVERDANEVLKSRWCLFF